jgi:predicted DNA-binding transcriptional regulator YafY
MEIEKAQGLIEKSILSGKQIEIEYTNSRRETKTYRIATITSILVEYFKSVVESAIPGGKNTFKNFRYDRISKVDMK